MTSSKFTHRDFWKYLTRVHKWTGFILGLQITIWLASGFFMTLFPIDDIRGRHLAAQTNWPLSETNVIPIDWAMSLYEGELTGASLATYVTQPVYTLTGDAGTQLIDAQSGEPWRPVDVDVVRLAAQDYYKGGGEITSLAKLEVAPPEYRRSVPVWQVQFNDDAKTRLYLDADTARLNAVRTRLWRAYDFMWMLHIMDYETRDNFNSWWLRLFAGLSFLFALTGLGLVIHRIFLRPKPRRGTQLTKG